MRKCNSINGLQVNICQIRIVTPDIGKPHIEQDVAAAILDKCGKAPFGLPVHSGGLVLAKQPDAHHSQS